jgi:glyoxylase-like metal-dependent hydrolase (beta-lactamase superfamily II)
MISRILAPNPGLYTGPGTNTYIIESDGEALVLDPGPIIDTHAVEIVQALEGLQPVGVVATHTHSDHAPLANSLASTLDVPVYGYQEGPQFLPDITVADGETIGVGSIGLLAVHTPGHTPDHLCFRVDDVLFTGDHIMGGSTVIIEDAAQYLDSLYLVRDLHVARLEPGHGNAMDDAAAAINDYIDHRLERERQIIEAIAGGASSIGDIVDVVYMGIPSGLRGAAIHQVGVQISKLYDDGAVSYDDRRLGDHTTIRLS